MSTESLSVPVRVGDRFVVGRLSVEVADSVRLTLDLEGREAIRVEGSDVIAALTELRRQVESGGGLLWVNGARRNVHASGMLRQARGGRLAYVLPERPTPEQPPTTDVLAGAPPDADVVSRAEQEQWFDAYRGVSAGASANRRPSPREMAEARRNPGAWVYVISGDRDPDDEVPPEAIEGAWKVGPDGVIVGDFVENPRYQPSGQGER